MSTPPRFAVAAIATLLAICFTSVSASAQGPFAGSDSSSTATAGPTFGQMASKLNPANWTMPKMSMPKLPSLLPGQADRERIVKKKDGLFADVKDTTKRSWQRTKEVLNPAKLNPMNMFAGNTTKSPTSDSKPGFFSSLFAAPEPEERVATVTDFLGQERPR